MRKIFKNKLYGICGKSGSGKTIVLLKEAIDIAQKGQKVKFVSFENTYQELYTKALKILDVSLENIVYNNNLNILPYYSESEKIIPENCDIVMIDQFNLSGYEINDLREIIKKYQKPIVITNSIISVDNEVILIEDFISDRFKIIKKYNIWKYIRDRSNIKIEDYIRDEKN